MNVMNLVSCGEQNCRYQIDGCCTRSDLTVNAAGSSAAGCCYFEQR